MVLGRGEWLRRAYRGRNPQDRQQAVLLVATAEGTMELKRTYGGSEDDIAQAIIQITDLGFSPRKY